MIITAHVCLDQEQLQKALPKRNISCTPNKPLPDMPTEPQEQGSGHYACIAHVGCFALKQCTSQLFLSVHQTVIALCSHHRLCLDAACPTRQLQQQAHADIQAVHLLLHMLCASFRQSPLLPDTLNSKPGKCDCEPHQKPSTQLGQCPTVLGFWWGSQSHFPG